MEIYTKNASFVMAALIGLFVFIGGNGVDQWPPTLSVKNTVFYACLTIKNQLPSHHYPNSPDDGELHKTIKNVKKKAK